VLFSFTLQTTVVTRADGARLQRIADTAETLLLDGRLV